MSKRKKDVSKGNLEKCTSCNGKGYDGLDALPCEKCNGTGNALEGKGAKRKIVKKIYLPNSSELARKIICKLEGAFESGKWHHIVIAKNDDVFDIYKDGRFFEGKVSWFTARDLKDWKLVDKEVFVEFWFKAVLKIKNWNYTAKWNLANQIVW